jgi:hypothetical protein
MEIYILFLIGAFVLGVMKPNARMKRVLVAMLGMAFMVSVGYFVFRLM